MLSNVQTALQSLRPNAQWYMNGSTYDKLVWLDKEQSKPTKEDVDAEIIRLEQQLPLDQTKAKAKELIAATDWAVLPDVNLQNKQEFETYRATLRGLITNPVAEPEWPTEPQPIWS